jgi:uncharacterized protein (DUF1786 family)
MRVKRFVRTGAQCISIGERRGGGPIAIAWHRTLDRAERRCNNHCA